MVSKILGISVDILAISLLWIDSARISLVSKIILTIGCVVIGILLYLIEKSKAYEVVKDYCIDENNVNVFINKSDKFSCDSIVSILLKENEIMTTIAIGYVLEWKPSQYQIKIIKVLDEKKLFRINTSKKSYKNFIVKPNIRYSDVETSFVS